MKEDDKKVEAVDVTTAPTDPKGITTEKQAAAHVKKNYEVPDGMDVVYVTQDANVFWKHNESEAYSHAHRNGIKIHKIKWPYQQ